MKLSVEKTKHAIYWKRTISNVFGEETAQEVLKEVDSLYLKMCEDNCGDTSEMKVHTEHTIYPLIALYKTLTSYLGKADGMKVTEQCFLESVNMEAKTLKNFINSKNLLASFPGEFAKQMQNSYSEKAGFKMELIISEEKTARFNILECPYEKTTKKYGCLELCHCFCMADEMCYSKINEKLHWNRTHTLAENGDYCDFALEYID